MFPMVRCSISCCVLWLLLLLLVTAAGVLAITAGILHSSLTSAQVEFLITGTCWIIDCHTICKSINSKFDLCYNGCILDFEAISHSKAFPFQRILLAIYIWFCISDARGNFITSWRDLKDRAGSFCIWRSKRGGGRGGKDETPPGEKEEAAAVLGSERQKGEEGGGEGGEGKRQFLVEEGEENWTWRLVLMTYRSGETQDNNTKSGVKKEFINNMSK